MARVVYQTPVRVGGTTIQVERTENMCEDWTWRTVKLIGFIIGSFAVLWWIFQGGRMFEQYFPSSRSRTTGTVVTTPSTPTPPLKSGGKKGTIKRPPPPALPSLPSPAPTVIKVEVEPIQVQVQVTAPPPSPTWPNLPPNKW